MFDSCRGRRKTYAILTFDGGHGVVVTRGAVDPSSRVQFPLVTHTYVSKSLMSTRLQSNILFQALPQAVQEVLFKLKGAGFEGFIVGGCLRDLILERAVRDWDVTTNATPTEIQKIFPKSFYANAFGTVTVQSDGMEIEVTTYRSETKYSDKRHPDAVQFGVTLEDDLQRRDFTMNAIASDGAILHDPFQGSKDIQKRLIRAVGNPKERFEEDALRMLRAIRFAAELHMRIESHTWSAILSDVRLIDYLSKERVRDEIMKIVASDDPLCGFWLLMTSGALQRIIPELLKGENVSQNKHHIYTVLFHNLFSMAHCPSDDPLVRLAALLHDVGKPHTKQGEGTEATFYQHEIVGATMTRKIMRRLTFSNAAIERVCHLVRHHMFYYNIGEITDAGVRRFIRRVGKENISDLFAVRIGDRMGSGVQKDKPFKLIELEKRIEEVQKDPIDTRMLALDGNDVMRIAKLAPGRTIGILLYTLLEEVLEDPTRNNSEYLEQRIQALAGEAKQGILPIPRIMKEDQKQREERLTGGQKYKRVTE